jgi:uncharacterized protein (DUF362 family)
MSWDFVRRKEKWKMESSPKNKTGHSARRSAISRREFLHGMGVTVAGLVLAGCQTATPTEGEVAPTDDTTLPQENTSATLPPYGEKPVVAIAKADSYDPALVLKQVQSLLDNIGGLKDILAHGNRVAIKVNLTGGTGSQPLPGTTEIETYLTHPAVVLALCKLLRDAGVKDLYIVEAVYQKESWSAYGYDSMAKSIGATLIDLSDAAPYKDFASTPTPGKPFIYDKFTFNPILNEVDAFISVSKMKCHNTAGVTHTMKNLFGLVPYRFYTLKSGDSNRSGFHGQASETRERLPGVILDLNRARPVNLSLIDGIKTSEGGEGPWIAAMTPIEPGVLFAGKNPVATDAIATAAMGFKPNDDYPNAPFLHARNHLAIAAQLGLGPNRVEDIKVVGAALKDVTVTFKASA